MLAKTYEQPSVTDKLARLDVQISTVYLKSGDIFQGFVLQDSHLW